MIRTLPEMLLHTLEAYPKDDFMLFKEGGRYVPLSTEEFGKIRIDWKNPDGCSHPVFRGEPDPILRVKVSAKHHHYLGIPAQPRDGAEGDTARKEPARVRYNHALKALLLVILLLGSLPATA